MTLRVALVEGRPLSHLRCRLGRLRPAGWAAAWILLAGWARADSKDMADPVAAPGPPTITRVPVVLPVPAAVIDGFMVNFRDREWSVGGLSRRAALAEWTRLPLRSELQAGLGDARIWRVADEGDFRLVPPIALLEAFSSEERRVFHGWLAGVAGNKIERWPLVYASPDALRRQGAEAGVASALVERAIQLSYPFEGGWALSDYAVLAAEFPAEDLRRWLAALSARPGFIPRLHVERAVNLADTLAYWTLNGRHNRIRPILLALLKTPSARGHEIGPLLPGAAAGWANDSAPDQVHYDVTPMSFRLAVSLGDAGRPPPGGQTVAAWFAAAFAPVEGPRRFGDILVLKPGPATPLTFACSWIDEGIVFARDPVALGLWRFLTLDELRRRNPHFADGTWLTYRRRDRP